MTRNKHFEEFIKLKLQNTRVRAHKRSGGDSMMETPVPMPNTEVKHHNGEDSERLRQ